MCYMTNYSESNFGPGQDKKFEPNPGWCTQFGLPMRPENLSSKKFPEESTIFYIYDVAAYKTLFRASQVELSFRDFDSSFEVERRMLRPSDFEGSLEVIALSKLAKTEIVKFQTAIQYACEQSNFLTTALVDFEFFEDTGFKSVNVICFINLFLGILILFEENSYHYITVHKFKEDQLTVLIQDNYKVCPYISILST